MIYTKVSINNVKQAEAEVVPSLSLVELEVKVEVEVQLRCNLEETLLKVK